MEIKNALLTNYFSHSLFSNVNLIAQKEPIFPFIAVIIIAFVSPNVTFI